MPSKARAARKPKLYHVRCYVEWLRLKRNPEYRKASEEIQKVERKVYDARRRGSEEKAQKAVKALESKQAEVCQRFDLITWAHPDDLSVTFENADAIIRPRWPVYAMSPWRNVNGKGTRADEDGWLYLKVNLLAPFDETERMLSGVLRAHSRAFPISNTRHRPDADLKAVQVWDQYQRTPNFATVARTLKQNASTVKGRFVRACVLVTGTRPQGSMKERRVSGIKDPAGEFESHLSSCGKCQRAQTADQFCSKWAGFVNQDTKARRESPRPN